jgi:hypothetical protein
MNVDKSFYKYTGSPMASLELMGYRINFISSGITNSSTSFGVDQGLQIKDIQIDLQSWKIPEPNLVTLEKDMDVSKFENPMRIIDATFLSTKFKDKIKF